MSFNIWDFLFAWGKKVINILQKFEYKLIALDLWIKSFRMNRGDE